MSAQEAASIHALGTESQGLPRESGLNVRVHFDGFSSKWDEWYGSKDVATGES